MARTRRWWCIGALALAACGGGDDDGGGDPEPSAAETDPGAASDGSDDGPSSEPEGGSAPATTLDNATAEDDGIDRGPQLSEVATIEIPLDDSLAGFNGIALSPSGDRIAVVTRVVDADARAEVTLTVFDIATGGELATVTDERIGAELFWTTEDRLFSGGNFGELWEWDTETLASVSEAPFAAQSLNCGSDNGSGFDPVANALYLHLDGLCRIDLSTGETVVYDPDGETIGNLRVAIGGNEVYMKWATDGNILMRRVFDATTLEVIADETADPIVIAASGNGRIEKVSGLDYVVQPSGQEIGFFGVVVRPSAGGGYYFGERDGALAIVSSADGGTVGWIDISAANVRDTSWSADDTVFATRVDGMLAVYAIG